MRNRVLIIAILGDSRIEKESSGEGQEIPRHTSRVGAPLGEEGDHCTSCHWSLWSSV